MTTSMVLPICFLTAVLPGAGATHRERQDADTLLQLSGSRLDPLAEDLGADELVQRKAGRSPAQDTSSLIMRMDGELRGLGDDLQDANLAARMRVGFGDPFMNNQAIEPAVLLQQQPGEPVTVGSANWLSGDKELDQATSQLFSAEKHAQEAEQLLDGITKQVYQTEVRNGYVQPAIPQVQEDATYLLNRRPGILQVVDPRMQAMGVDPNMQAMQAIGGAIYRGEEQGRQVQQAMKAEADSRELTERLQAEVQRAEGGEAVAQRQAKQVTQKAEETILGLWQQLQTSKAGEVRAEQAAQTAEKGLLEYRSLLERSRSELDRSRSELQQARLTEQQSTLELQATRSKTEMFRQQLEDAQARATAQSPGLDLPPAWPALELSRGPPFVPQPLQAYPQPPPAAYLQPPPVQASLDDPAMYLQSLNGWRAQ